MTFGTLAGMLTSDMILGRDNPWKGLYAPGRLNVAASAGTFVRENIDYPVHMVTDRLHRADVESLAEVARGEGKIVELGGEKTAVYRDARGLLHAVSPVCTHMRCHVSF